VQAGAINWADAHGLIWRQRGRELARLPGIVATAASGQHDGQRDGRGDKYHRPRGAKQKSNGGPNHWSSPGICTSWFGLQ
jgi:hypothetical protein